MPTPTFIPTVNPSFPAPDSPQWREEGFRSPKGYDIGRVMGVRPIRTVPLTWRVISKNQLDEILSFFTAMNGATGPFFWTPLDTVMSPNGQTPTLGEVAGGALTSQPEYFVQYTWYDTSAAQETLGSKEAAFTVQDNFQLTVDVPVFPMAVGEWRVYVGIVTGDAELQTGTVTTRQFIMPAARVSGGANPPIVNDLSLPLLWKFEGRPQVTKITANRFSLSMTFVEQTAL